MDRRFDGNLILFNGNEDNIRAFDFRQGEISIPSKSFTHKYSARYMVVCNSFWRQKYKNG
mgnify:CR=1 FL=1